MSEFATDFHALLVVYKPPKDPQTNDDRVIWKDFVTNFHTYSLWRGLENEPHKREVWQLAENVWLIPLKDGLLFLARLVATAKMVRLPYKVIYFDKAPTWLTSEHKSNVHAPWDEGSQPTS